MLSRCVVWRNPYAAVRLPLLVRLHRAAYCASPRLRHELLKIPLRRLFAWAYRLGLGGRGAFARAKPHIVFESSIDRRLDQGRELLAELRGEQAPEQGHLELGRERDLPIR